MNPFEYTCSTCGRVESLKPGTADSDVNVFTLLPMGWIRDNMGRVVCGPLCPGVARQYRA